MVSKTHPSLNENACLNGSDEAIIGWEEGMRWGKRRTGYFTRQVREMARKERLTVCVNK
jgi:hypothetical protein